MFKHGHVKSLRLHAKLLQQHENNLHTQGKPKHVHAKSLQLHTKLLHQQQGIPQPKTLCGLF